MNDDAEVSWNVVETDGGYIIVAGGWTSLIIKKINNNGNNVWDKIYNEPGNIYYAGGSGSLIKTIDGGWALAFTDKEYAKLWKFNEVMDTLWNKNFGDTAFWNAVRQCKQTFDNGYVIIGRTEKSDFPDGDFWLIKTDSSGNMEWDTTYGGVEYEYGVSVDATKDSGYIVVGATDSYGQGIGSTSDIYVIKVDSIGKIQWSGVYGGPFGDAVWNVEHTSDGGYIIGGGLTDSAPGGYPYSRPYLIKLDSAGNTEWEKTYGPVRFQTTLRMVRELPDGSFIACGQTSDSIGFHGMGLVLKVASNGDSIWYRTHEILTGSSSQNFLYDIRPTSDNGFISAGWLKPSSPDTGGQDMWVVKMDSCGCLVPYCDTLCTGPPPDTTGMEEFEVQSLKFKVYPNPTEGKFTIQIFNEAVGEKQFEINIYDILGRNITHTCTERGSASFDSAQDKSLTSQSISIKTGAKQIEVDISKHPAGVYLIQVWNENNYYSTRVVKY